MRSVSATISRFGLSDSEPFHYAPAPKSKRIVTLLFLGYDDIYTILYRLSALAIAPSSRLYGAEWKQNMN